MGAGAPGGAAAAGAAVVIAEATKASGAIVAMEPQDFLCVIGREEQPLVIRAKGGVWTKRYRYLTSHKGMAFFTKSVSELSLPAEAEVIEAKKIWIPE